MRVDYSLLFGFVLLVVCVGARSVTLLENSDILGEGGVQRKIIAPLLTEEELRMTEPQKRPSINIKIRPHRLEAIKVDADTDTRADQVDEYSEDPFETSKE